jgi:hypothetical protein
MRTLACRAPRHPWPANAAYHGPDIIKARFSDAAFKAAASRQIEKEGQAVHARQRLLCFLPWTMALGIAALVATA